MQRGDARWTATKPQQKAAKDNPWYRLATLHGKPWRADDERAAKNRETWNRWMAPELLDEVKTVLREKGWSDRELTPLCAAEQQVIAAKVGLTLEPGEKIDFSGIGVEARFFAWGFIFPDADFSGTTFSKGADFGSAAFIGYARFESVTFIGNTFFESATFSQNANFESAKFSEDGTTLTLVRFADATFSHWANFQMATFSVSIDTDFSGANFSSANFGRAKFSSSANFRLASFNDRAAFGSVNFTRRADFSRVIFGGDADFSRATFNDVADFVNADMQGPATFDDVRFSEPPRCFNAKLHEGTTWYDTRWPETPRDVARAKQFIDAYARLKLEMDRLKNHQDELWFFSQELRCRRVVEGFWKGLPIAIYGSTSGYGQSYLRPLVLIVAVLLVGAFLVGWHLIGFWDPIPVRAFGLSFANTFSVLGIRREFTDPTTFQQFPGWLTFVGAVQSIFGIVLLFLFGLGIRNRFRIK